MTDSEGPIRVVGIGSVLMSDDGIGPSLVERLRGRWRFPEGVELVDAGTPGPELLYMLQESTSVLLVDAVRTDGEPGSLRRYGREQLLDGTVPQRLSPHDPGLREALLTAALTDEVPDRVELIGLIPDRVELGTGLSSRARAGLPGLEGVALEILRGWGVVPERRDGEAPSPWWERADQEATATRIESASSSPTATSPPDSSST